MSLQNVGFIALGLYLIYRGMVWDDAHSSFTFVLIVLGCAVFLFGTGSQATAHVSQKGLSDASASVVIVGGAAVLTMLISFGLIQYHTEIGDAFSKRTKYVSLPIQLETKRDGRPVPGYLAEARILNSGEMLPTFRRNNITFVNVPELELERAADLCGSSSRSDVERVDVTSEIDDGESCGLQLSVSLVMTREGALLAQQSGYRERTVAKTIPYRLVRRADQMRGLFYDIGQPNLGPISVVDSAELTRGRNLENIDQP